MLKRPVDLRHVAEWTGTTIDDIQTLNPELRRRTTPLTDAGYPLKVPPGSAPTVTARLNRALDKDLASFTWYTVKGGETLGGIARKLAVNLTDLADANYLKMNARLAPGQQLIVPRESTVLMTARADRPVRTSGMQAGRDGVVPAVMNDSVRVMYRVQRGDTLSSIALLFKTSVDALRSWNEIAGTQIREGERLTIYTSRASN
jgi:membrane-bound lytic murein transglycosylase D